MERVMDDILTRAMLGEVLSAEEQAQLKARNFRYELVRTLYMEKMRALGVNIKNFHFTPGDKWMDLPVYDLISSLIGIHEKRESGEYKPIDISELDS
jgi:hypothetical protein